jgi:undecaprenyl-phosphate 4-deoxy-4-formamido-L-arabinose transferase
MIRERQNAAGADSVPLLPDGLSILIPVYNSAGILPNLVERVLPVANSLNMPFELILVNDGSRDRSWDVVRELAEKHHWVRGFCLMRNYGQHNAVLCGIRGARFGTIVTMDDDLQHSPEELPKLLAKMKEGFDVVYGTPEQEQHGLFRNLASVITKVALQSAMGAETARVVSAWRVFRTQLRDAFASYCSPFVSIDVLLSWGTAKFGSVHVRHGPRKIGKSNYTFPKLVRHAMTMMTGLSVLPLRLASIMGFVFTLFGLGVLAYVVGRYLVAGSSVAGFPFLASIIAIFSGAQLFALGIIGEYFARMHFRMLDKPPYAVLETTGSKANRLSSQETSSWKFPVLPITEASI